MYGFFYDVAVYANTNWAKGTFTPKEVAENAYFYTVDFENCNSSIETLIENLAEDRNNGSEEADRLLTELLDMMP